MEGILAMKKKQLSNCGDAVNGNILRLLIVLVVLGARTTVEAERSYRYALNRSYNGESLFGMLESDAVRSSSPSREPLLVGLTLIHKAASRGAGNLFL